MPDNKAMSLPLELRTLLAGLQSAEVSDDQQWLLALLRQSGLAVVTLLWRMLGSEADVLDAYQTAVCQLTGRGREAVGLNPGAYFYRTAMNAGITVLRNRRQRCRQWPAIVDAQTRRDASRSSPSAEEVVDQRQSLDRMRQAIYLLPPHLREVIILRDLAELPYSQVAAILKIRNGTARLYRHQAVTRLAELIGQVSAESRAAGGREGVE